MLFMWRARANLPSDYIFPVSPSTELGLRIFICVVLGTGIAYGTLIMNTFRKYGTRMDEAWKLRVESFIATTVPAPAYPPPPQYPQTTIIPRPSSSSGRSSDSDQTPYIAATLGPRGLGDGPAANPAFHGTRSSPWSNLVRPLVPRGPSPPLSLYGDSGWQPQRGEFISCSRSRTPPSRRRERSVIRTASPSYSSRRNSPPTTFLYDRRGRSPSPVHKSDERRGRSSIPRPRRKSRSSSMGRKAVPPDTLPIPFGAPGPSINMDTEHAEPLHSPEEVTHQMMNTVVETISDTSQPHRLEQLIMTNDVNDVQNRQHDTMCAG